MNIRTERLNNRSMNLQLRLSPTIKQYPWIIQGLTFLSAWKTQCI